MARKLASVRVLGEVASYAFVIFLSVYDFGGFGANEVNKLAAAKKHAQPSWLANDWFLSLEGSRYEAFHWFAGQLVDHLGFAQAAVVGRLLCYLALGFAFARLRNSLRLPWPWTLAVLALFTLSQSLVAGEWMAGGFEPKSLAYAALLLAVVAYSRGALSVGAAWAGAALSLHPLVGAYGAVSLFCAALVYARTADGRLTAQVCRQWPFLLTGAVGIIGVAGQLSTGVDVDGATANWVYTYFRNPHHVSPEYWGIGTWPIVLATLGLLSSVLLAVARNVGRIRFLALFVAASTCIFAGGIAAWLLGVPSLLKYYPFRLADVFLPLWLLLLAAWLVARRKALARALEGWPMRGRCGAWIRISPNLAGIFVVIYTCLAALPAARFRAATLGAPPSVPFAPPPLLGWIAGYTDPDAVLLAPPSLSSVYLHAQRATVATFKHAPHSAAGILEWYERIKALNGGATPSKRGFAAVDELDRGYARLSEPDVLRLAASYGATHMLAKRDAAYRFEPLREADGWVLYRLRHESR